ncbi:hypothetical protein GE09DRAFT_1047626 [Coniochaeta sp. 2T2.1]|nr:hypothetical protein GE09DRAFT_1047626 [Coniochaeta sp. 2T2.1]
MASDLSSPKVQQYAYRSVRSLSESQLAHKRHWDRARQRQHRAASKHRVAELESALRDVRGLLKSTEEERDMLRTLLQSQKPALDGLRKERDRLREMISSAFRSMQESSPLPHLEDSGTEATVEPYPDVGSPENAPFPGLSGNSETSASIRASDSTRPLVPQTENSLALYTVDSLLDTWPLSLSLLPDASTDPWDDNGILRFVRDYPSPAFESPDIAETWSRLPLNCASMCRLDQAILDMEQTCRDLSARTSHIMEFSTPAFPHVSSLLNPTTASLSHKQPIASTVVARIISQMPVGTPIMQLAATWLLCNLIRWRLCLTPGSFSALPVFLRPTELQLRIPHPIWVDTIVWPTARDRIIQQFDYNDFDALRHALGKSISPGWPCGISECLSSTGTPGEFSLSPEFQTHLWDLSNWTVDPALVQAFPFLEGAVNVRDNV